MHFFMVENEFLILLKAEYFQTNWDLEHSNLKILTLKLVVQRLPIALAQVKTGNTSENLLNEIRKIIYFLYRAKEITKKVYNNIMNSIKV